MCLPGSRTNYFVIKFTPLASYCSWRRAERSGKTFPEPKTRACDHATRDASSRIPLCKRAKSSTHKRMLEKWWEKSESLLDAGKKRKQIANRKKVFSICFPWCLAYDKVKRGIVRLWRLSSRRGKMFTSLFAFRLSAMPDRLSGPKPALSDCDTIDERVPKWISIKIAHEKRLRSATYRPLGRVNN